MHRRSDPPIQLGSDRRVSQGCAAVRPGTNHRYTNNFPYDPLAGNRPTDGVLLRAAGSEPFCAAAFTPGAEAAQLEPGADCGRPESPFWLRLRIFIMRMLAWRGVSILPPKSSDPEGCGPLAWTCRKNMTHAAESRRYATERMSRRSARFDAAPAPTTNAPKFNTKLTHSWVKSARPAAAPGARNGSRQVCATEPNSAMRGAHRISARENCGSHPPEVFH